MRGEKRKLVAMALKNARDEAEKRRKKLSRSRERTVGAAKELQRVLGLETYPRRIEAVSYTHLRPCCWCPCRRTLWICRR